MFGQCYVVALMWLERWSSWEVFSLSRNPPPRHITGTSPLPKTSSWHGTWL